VALDRNFSSDAYAALLGQLHAMGQAPLPADLNALFDLLYLIRKLIAQNTIITPRSREQDHAHPK
jgi:hypothetical protein